MGSPSILHHPGDLVEHTGAIFAYLHGLHNILQLANETVWDRGQT
jgi:hypothetical protein